MRLMKVLAASGFLQAAVAALVRRGSPENGTRSDHSQPALSLASVLHPVNATHVECSITNTYPQQISILIWNNLFQKNQHAAYASFELTRTLPDGSIQQLSRGPTMGQYRFAEMVPSHFVNISAGGFYTDVFDLTKLFDVFEEATYNVTVDFTSLAKLDAKDTSLRVKSNTIAMKIQASSTSRLERRQTSAHASACSNLPQTYAAILKARGQARSLAKFSQQYVLPPLGIAAHGLLDDTLWNQYFKNDSAARNVTSVFNAIANYGLNGNVAGIQEICDVNEVDDMCTDDTGVIAYNLPARGTADANGGGGSPSITFCSGFFNLSAAETCTYATESNMHVADQGGVLLHELAKCEALTKVANVTDGPDDDCSTWTCITSAVAGEVKLKPYLLAGAYEYFAYAARARGSSQCPSQTAVGPQVLPSTPHGPPRRKGMSKSSSSFGSIAAGGSQGGGQSGAGGVGSGSMSGTSSNIGGNPEAGGSGMAGQAVAGLGGPLPRSITNDTACGGDTLSC